ncbi:uncharacterized protein AMSG_04788 [Thecamonas trahens ATCC 50062]|uniref:Gamma-secretase subunit Aph-1 n=1 Tax=Thecamonas trahens ATCC 50062 TaxID=461836 RepID=A0A0L0DAL4_THETB|nr:hypothetical protein AMSG_04788 [Thecamonas trahens ATCC 50062]KNC48338.1 hypothetical protein AMSG_04788 [Thecamonas trahens ATCC 50062]|eukprot:XP_013758463.1 hypothetical protein AMSG_04788 [Thecamonas trahens ATCC 50062]
MQSSYGAVVFFSVVISEAVRGLFHMLWAKIELRLLIEGMRPLDIYRRMGFATAAGLGYAAIHALASYGGLLYEGRGPGALFTPACPATSLFFINALSTLAFVLLNIVFMPVAFYGYHRSELRYPAAVAAIHLAASWSTLLFKAGGSCAGGVALLYAIVALAAALAFHVGRKVNMEQRMSVM